MTLILEGEFSGARTSAYDNGVDIEICLPEWSGRLDRGEAVTEIEKLINFLNDVKKSIQPPSPVPSSDLYCSVCGQPLAECYCDHCERSGHSWSPTYKVDGKPFHCCVVCLEEEARTSHHLPFQRR
jgi:hypothetical protein